MNRTIENQRIMNAIQEYPKLSIEPGVDLQPRKGGVLIIVRNPLEKDLDRILNDHIQVSGRKYIFERDLKEENMKLIFIPEFVSPGHFISVKLENATSHENVDLYRYLYGYRDFYDLRYLYGREIEKRFRTSENGEFFYIGNEERAHELFDKYFRFIRERYNVEVLIVSGLPTFMSPAVSYMWNGVDKNGKAILYRDDFTYFQVGNSMDEQLINESVSLLELKLLEKMQNR